METELHKIAKQLLETQKVSTIIGYTKTERESIAPIFIERQEDCSKLVWNDRCYYNLSLYLTKKELAGKKVAVVAKGCDVSSIICLLAENQISRENIMIIGVSCNGVKLNNSKIATKCFNCERRIPSMYDFLIGSKDALKDLDVSSLDEEVLKIESMDPKERWEFWKNEFDRCIKCYACRQICPLCFCESCIVEKSTPQWISTNSSFKGNFSWHIIRAFHLVGRCSGCQECYRVCPQGIRLDLLNRKMTIEVKKAFGYEAPRNANEKPPLCVYKKEDKEDFIR